LTPDQIEKFAVRIRDFEETILEMDDAWALRTRVDSAPFKWKTKRGVQVVVHRPVVIDQNPASAIAETEFSK
jgi:tRNA nucleotidyltransferase (CCA-adding enzyme)